MPTGTTPKGEEIEMCDTYNGWKNRETWALQLWLSNDQGLSEMVLERVREGLLANPETEGYPAFVGSADEEKEWDGHRAGDIIRELWGELTDPAEGLLTPTQILAMVTDIGSDYRVDWDEIGAAWVEDLS